MTIRGFYRRENGKICLDIRLKTISQLFDSRDLSPFKERDLDEHAVDYIVSSAQEHRPSKGLKIVIHLSDEDPKPLDSATIRESIHRYFQYEDELIRSKLRHTLRQGFLALVIGLVFLLGSVSFGQFIGRHDFLWASVLREGFIIMGWVAMWRPIDVFLYSWWPQAEYRRLMEKLSRTEVEIRFQS